MYLGSAIFDSFPCFAKKCELAEPNLSCPYALACPPGCVTDSSLSPAYCPIPPFFSLRLHSLPHAHPPHLHPSQLPYVFSISILLSPVSSYLISPVAGAYRRGCLPFHCVRQALRALKDLPIPNQPLGLPPPCPTPAPGVTSPSPSNAPAGPVSSSPLLCSAWPWVPSWAYTLAWPKRGAWCPGLGPSWCPPLPGCWQGGELGPGCQALPWAPPWGAPGTLSSWPQGAAGPSAPRQHWHSP